MKPIDSLTYKTFVSKFNEKYSGTLSEQQKALLSKYISSFSDNGLDLKIYLNEEIGRLKEKVESSLNTREVSEDAVMKQNTERVLSELKAYSKKEIDTNMIQSLLKIQDLVLELNS